MTDEVNHPAHYGGDTTYETIKVIEAWDLDFCLGNTVKYISRAGKKGDELTDLKKAQFYLERRIGQLESQDPPQTVAKQETKDTKRCNTCGKTRPLSEFGKNRATADGYANKCKQCKKDYETKWRKKKQQEEREMAPARPAKVSQMPSSARSCANGERCVGYDEDDPYPAPAALAANSRSPLCGGCQRRAGVA